MAYPRVSASNGTLGVEQILTIKSWSNQYIYDITYTCGEVSETILEKDNDRWVSFTPPIDLASQNTRGTSVEIILKLTAYNVNDSDDVNVYSEYIICDIPESVKPSCEVDIYDASGVFDMYDAYVQNLSRLEVSISATESYGSPIAIYETHVDGSKYTEPEFLTSKLKSSGSATFKASVTDQRGRTSEAVTRTLTVLEYTPPSVSKLATVRCDSEGREVEQGDYLLVTFSAAVSPLDNKNTAEYELKYKKSTDDEWNSVTFEDLHNQYSATDYTYKFQADKDSSYDVEVVVTDNHIATKRANNAPTGFLLMHFNLNGTAMAFGKVSERENAIEFGVETYDKFGAIISNGLAVHTGDDDSAVDPDTTFEHCILTNKNTPTNARYFIVTLFHNDKNSDKMQTAYPYNSDSAGHFYRYHNDGVWSEWKSTALDAYPVGSYYIAHHNTSPAELFGGAWYRLENRFLWAAASTDTIGLTDGEKEHTLTEDEMPRHDHWGVTRPDYLTDVDGVQAYARTTDYNGTNLVTDKRGGDEAHNNMPPYVNVAIWRRVS